MGVITISRGSFSRGREIAEKLAENLGYECISREILVEASTHFNVPEVKLTRAIHDPPSILERFKHGKEKYIILVRQALLEHIQRGNVVYHGLAGQFLIKEIPNILKVRIIANIDQRVKEKMARLGVDEKMARSLLEKDDAERVKWSMALYGIDTRSPDLYDIVIHIDKLQVDDAVQILADIAKRPCYQFTPEVRTVIMDSYLAAKAHAAIFDWFPSAEVKSKGQVVYVQMEGTLFQKGMITDKISEILRDVEGIKEIRVNLIPY